MGNTLIDWATKTWNPIEGCNPCSPGCERCYARPLAKRLKLCHAGQARYGTAALYRDIEKWDGTLAEFPDRWYEPFHWRKPQRVFVGSRSDVALWPTSAWLNVIRVATDTERHRYLLLTKRPQLQAKRWPSIVAQNVWLGVTACNQAEADAKIPALLRIPAAGYWLSVEPMLGPITIDPVHLCQDEHCRHALLSWVVVGGESGKGARPMAPEWARSLRDQCNEAGVKYWFKQWGDAGSCPPLAPCRTFRDYLDGRQHHELPAALRLPGEVEQ